MPDLEGVTRARGPETDSPAAAGSRTGGPGAGRVPAWLRGRGWLLLLPLCFLVYANSFNDLPIIDREHSVLGDADAANFRLLLEDFSLTRIYGDPYNTVNRGIGDIAQKHKVHHVTYNLLGGVASRLFQTIYRPLGLTQKQAIFSVNALVGCLNILLLYFLLRGLRPRGNPIWPFLLLYAGALSTWIFSSVPESWPFSASLVIGFLLLLQRPTVRPLLAGVALGVIMLNNLFLAAMFPLLVLRSARDEPISWTWWGKMFVAGLLSVVTWLAALAVLSLFDPHFRPDHFLHYTLWFREFTAPDLPATDPYVWKSAFSNLFITSVVSHQPDPAMPQEALLLTLRSGLLGVLATAGYGVVVLLAFVGAMRKLLARDPETPLMVRLAQPESVLLLWTVLMLAVTGIAFYPSGFLYSVVVVPVLIALLYAHLDLNVRWQQALFYGAIALILVNNGIQVLEFRATLGAM